MKKVIVDASTGQATYVDMTPEEIAEAESIRASLADASEAQRLEAERLSALKTSARQKLVSGQPLTPEEAAVLVV